ncbi:MAG: pyridoxamine 5'-phosphate oxidase family protein [Oscillatoria sp. Prado101]|jgi:PPOX class probable FMN-dependent enzyme|nr:pyridoxamine 5'-phosphate oxidase family protein [Oscillatoria sp. Prado101]
MSLALWRTPLARALYRNRSLLYARYLQLATVGNDGKPANRTVVFRGFLGDTNQLKFVTDARSEKAGQIESNPWGEACWYFPKTREQFRISGMLRLVRDTELDSELQKARQIAWLELSEGARGQFARPHPGKPRADAGAFAVIPPADTEPLPHFCLLLLLPAIVDHLELRGEPQNRWIYRLDMEGGWEVGAVNP